MNNSPSSTTIPPRPTEEELRFLSACAPQASMDEFLDRMRIFGEFLYETNRTMNLTRIPPDVFWCKHVCDSLSVLRALPELAGSLEAMCDVGCGAGFPSLVLAAAFPQRFVVPVDSTGKKITFVRQAAERMGLNNVSPVQARAHEIARQAPYRGSFGFVTARAVADAPALIREVWGFLRTGGKLIVYRTMAQAEPELEILRKGDTRVTATEEFSLPGSAGRRMFLLIEKG